MAITELFLNDNGNMSRKSNGESFNPGVENTLTHTSQTKNSPSHRSLFTSELEAKGGGGGVYCSFSLSLVFFLDNSIIRYYDDSIGEVRIRAVL